MARISGLVSKSWDIDPEVSERFEEFCKKYPGDPKGWLVEFALIRMMDMKVEAFRRVWEPFYQWRSLRKRKIKLQVSQEKAKE